MLTLPLPLYGQLDGLLLGMHAAHLLAASYSTPLQEKPLSNTIVTSTSLQVIQLKHIGSLPVLDWSRVKRVAGFDAIKVGTHL